MSGSDAALVTHHHRSLTAYVRSMVASPATAADIVHETWARAIPSLRAGAVDNARAFLYRVARNLMVDDARDAVARRRVFVDGDPPIHVPDAAPLSDRILLDREALCRLHEAVAELGGRCREVLLLRRVQGLSAAEIADRLGISRQMVTRYLAQAMEHCLGRLDGDA